MGPKPRDRAGDDPASAGPRSHSQILRENSERYRAIVDTAVDAIIVADRFGNVQSFNRAAETIFGYSAAEVVGLNIKQLMPEPYQSSHDGYLAAYRQTGERKIIGIGREVPGRRKDGSIVQLELSIAEWRDVDGQQCFTGIMRDVTSRNQQEQELKNAKEAAEFARAEAESANRAKTEFLAVMSHEIRTPLTSISGFVDLLSRTGRLSSQQRRYIELVRTANAALLTIVDDILDFSKVEAGQLELDSRAFSPKRLVHDTVAIVRPIAQQKKLELHYVIDSGLSQWLMGDDARLRQVLLNLLNNAVKFTERGSITVDVRRQRGPGGAQQVRFEVADTGIGIPDDQQSRLFKQFSQADSSIRRRFGGTGLGLAICKRLIELMGGEIGIVSQAGAGSLVWFTAALPPALGPEGALSSESPAAGQYEGQARILLVDDLDTNREIVKAYLEDVGYLVDSAEGGIEALAMLERGRYDLVLMDVQMPVMDGVAATRQVRALPKPICEVPIIAITGNVLPAQVRSFLAAGMSDHVGKPIERARLYNTVRRWLPQPVARDERAAADTPHYERDRLDELISVLGTDRTENTVRSFAAHLAASFEASPASARQEAHDLLNTAGVLGFGELAALCRKVEQVPDGNTIDFAAALQEMRQEKAVVQDIVARQVLPGLRGRPLDAAE